MKKLALLFMLVLLVALAAPALAGDGDVQWAATKDIVLTETFTYTENVVFTGGGDFVFDGEAWAKIQEQQELYALTLDQIDLTGNFPTKTASITGSFNSGTGIANVNQAPGNLNNQGNEVALSLGNEGKLAAGATPPTTFFGMYCEAQVVSVQYNGIFFDPNTPAGTLGGTRNPQPNNVLTAGFVLTDSIADSFNGFTGVASVNQSAGSLNNQGNAVAIAGGVGQTIVKAATDVILAQANAYNVMTEGTLGPNLGGGLGNITSDSISGSYNGAFGVFNVNQSAGYLNNQKNVVAIGFSGPIKP